jgi:diguanylate cyclase (GGDEF)-like protein
MIKLDHLSREDLEKKVRAEAQARESIESLLDSRTEDLRNANASLQEVCDTLSARIGELEAERARVLHIGRTDALTGLMNRGAFLNGLTEKLAAASRFGATVGLYVIDLDRFKDINDTLGHEAGDMLLQAVAARLVSVARTNDIVARLGGDEFAIIAEMKTDGAEAAPLAKRVLQALLESVTIMGRSVSPGASIGVALFPNHAADAGDLQRYADLALYKAKADGRSRYKVFDADLKAEGEQRRILERDLRRAVEADEIVPWFQPVVDAASGRVTGVEVLARWNHPDQGLIEPDCFVPIAEELGIIGRIDARTFEKACAIAAPWVSAGLIESVACNVSPRELLDVNFADNLIARVDASGLPAAALIIEITEQFLVQDMELARLHIGKLAQHSVRVALDDFGIGYSNLRALMQLPIDTVKIDRSLTLGIGKDERVTALVRLLAQTTRSLGLSFVAEGVEDEAHAIHLRSIGCSRMQGFYFARPMPPENADAFLRASAFPVTPVPRRVVA